MATWRHKAFENLQIFGFFGKSPYICSENYKAWLFGSFARGEETPRSDVDILFVPDRSGKPFTLFTHGGMLMDLQELLGRDVDLVEEGSLRPYAAETANRDKILIYERKSER